MLRLCTNLNNPPHFYNLICIGLNGTFLLILINVHICLLTHDWWDFQIERNAQFTLGKLLELRVMDFKAEIANISNEATQEIGLEELLAKVQNKVSEIYKVQTKSFNK